MNRIKFKKSLVLSVIAFFLLSKTAHGFYECPVHPVPYKTTPEINNCLKLVAFVKSQGQNVAEWCSNANNYKQCCITCQNYNSCKNIAYDASCEEKARNNQCNQIMANFLPVSYFCQKSCNRCNSKIECNSLVSGCNGGQCYAATYFSQPSLQCMCPHGKGGTYCQESNACLLNPCLNQGECVPLYEQEHKYACSCKPGFYGKNCEFANVGCVNGQECENGGSCHYNQLTQAPYCKCQPGYVGFNCESYIGGCLNNKCYNGGSCIPSKPSPSQYYCVCPAGYSGYNCETKLLCHTLTCQNNGICRESISGGSPYCECQPNYSGAYCQNKNDGCSANPCKNSGTCIPLNLNDYFCICKEHYNGKNCQYMTNGCDRISCQNGGTCYLNTHGMPVCLCNQGFVGEYCQTYVGSCNSQVCLNGGTCIPNRYNGLHACICPSGYIGDKCEYKINCDRGDTNIAQCRSWSSMGFCNLKYTYNQMPVPVFCPISCNVCNLLCYDAVDQCPLWSSQGICGSINLQNNGLCRKSCGQCYYSKMKKDGLVEGALEQFKIETNATEPAKIEQEENPVKIEKKAEDQIEN